MGATILMREEDMKPSKNQKKILKAMSQLPEEIEPEELEALICSLVSSYVGFDNVPGYLLYLHLRTKAIIEGMMEESKRETKH
jgi:hypothetical protein